MAAMVMLWSLLWCWISCSEHHLTEPAPKRFVWGLGATGSEIEAFVDKKVGNRGTCFGGCTKRCATMCF